MVVTFAPQHFVVLISRQDVVALDPSLGKIFKTLREEITAQDDDEQNITDGVRGDEKLQGLLELEGLPTTTSPEVYMAHMVLDKQNGVHHPIIVR